MHRLDTSFSAEILQNGFLPQSTPCSYLQNVYYRPWENLMRELPFHIRRCQLRHLVLQLPVLSVIRLKDDAEWRRAYVILSFLTHAYLWSESTPAETLPPSITCPFLAVSSKLGLPPTATYAALNLWNFCATSPGVDLTVPENIRMLHTFTGTFDEEWFYLISVCVEARGAQIIPAVLCCFEAVRHNDIDVILGCLWELVDCINDLGNILDRMHEKCSPHVFYHQIRPFLAGSKGMAIAGLSNGVFYDEGNGKGQRREYSGGSNAQSSLIQLLDIVLGIEHFATGRSETMSSAPAVKSKQGYIEEMRNYMPEPHRVFLFHALSMANIREYAMNEKCSKEIRAAYQAAVMSLTVFRNKHIQIVARYIIAPSKQAPNSSQEKHINIATASTKATNEDNTGSTHLCGTGGTMLMPFLRQTREETRKAGLL